MVWYGMVWYGMVWYVFFINLDFTQAHSHEAVQGFL